MKRPSFQFYPADWKNNSKLRRCSEAARGAWIDVLCLLHDFDEYGVCRWPLAELARAAGIPLKLAKELADKDVLKGADKNAVDYTFTPRHAGKDGTPVTLVVAGDGPCWYCTRFVRDEHVRQKRGNGSRFTSENQPTNGAANSQPNNPPMPPFGVRQGDGPTSTSTSTSKPKAPKPPDGGLVPAAGKTVAIGLKAFLDQCQERDERPLRDYMPLWAYAERAGLELDFIALAWAEFRRRFLPGGTGEAKKYKNWRQAFQKYVEGNYFRLWAIGTDDKYFLTTLGKQVQKVNDTKEAA
jgi:hypothetical protein